MSFVTLGLAAEFGPQGVAVNALWPRTLIATEALNMIPGVSAANGRTPEIMADAAHAVLTREAPVMKRVLPARVAMVVPWYPDSRATSEETENRFTVIPANAGIHFDFALRLHIEMQDQDGSQRSLG